ncbi:hypothetical protein ACSBPU_05730 [Parapusillimonas sp. JC17]|uniref:hypothetical protein n=1 Tax=Parapusillimonas sp. JC17 TaxID=3445768 RepID=UPI003FA18199
MTRKLFYDLETYSPVPIKHGTHKYAEQAEVLLFAYAFDDGPVKVWSPIEEPGLLAPKELRQAAEDPDVQWWGHNSNQFDWTIIKHAMPALAELVSPARRFDTMVQAYAHGLPGGLDLLCDIFDLDQDQRKLKTGKALMRLFCIPPAKNLVRGRATHETHPLEWKQFREYATNDIVSMRIVHDRMPQWNYPRNADEMGLNQLDQRINDRGVQVDVELASAAIEAITAAQAQLSKRTQELTAGDVANATQRDKMLAHLVEAFGVELPDLRKSTLERRVADPELPAGLRELLAVRLQASTTSTAKYQTLLRGVSVDGRLRGILQFCGAARTGRWAGRLFQPQNLPRASHEQDEIDAGIEAIKTGTVDLLFDNVMAITSSTIRGAIVAPEGKKLVIADLSNIEGRVLAWLAGESWKLKAFRDFDTIIGYDERGKEIRAGHDLYKLAYSKSFGVAPDQVDKDQRQVGKVQELALGYEGGVGAFLTFAAAYGIDLEAMGEQAYDSLPADLREESAGFFAWCVKQKRNTFGLTEQAFVVCDTFKRSWRRAHPMVASLWRELGDAVVTAVFQPGVTFTVRKLKVRRDGNWLRIGLPSGRNLCYPSPRVDDGKFSYMGMDQYTKKWQRIHSYGGKLCIAEGTLVLTRTGWVPIEAVPSGAQVWDGIEWVHTDGAVCNGRKDVIDAYGAWMTADHEVLTVEGWKHASQGHRYDRLPCRLPDGVAVPRQRREEVTVAGGMPVRRANHDSRLRTEEVGSTRGDCVMWLQAQGDYRPASDTARHEQTPGVRGMAQHARPMPSPIASGLAQLWGAGHRCVQAVASILRELLGGYGSLVSTGADVGPRGQRRELRAGQLSVGNPDRPSEQHAEKPTRRRYDGGAVRRQTPAGPIDGLLPAGARGVRGTDGRTTRYRAPVYDLLNCGPRSRFVIAAAGQPLIVHNCENVTQAVARDVLASSMPAAEQDGYAIVLTVHDELITEAPDTPEYTHMRLAELMTTQPTWAADLPLAAAGFETIRYRKD